MNKSPEQFTDSKKVHLLRRLTDLSAKIVNRRIGTSEPNWRAILSDLEDDANSLYDTVHAIVPVDPNVAGDGRRAFSNDETYIQHVASIVTLHRADNMDVLGYALVAPRRRRPGHYIRRLFPAHGVISANELLQHILYSANAEGKLLYSTDDIY